MRKINNTSGAYPFYNNNRKLFSQICLILLITAAATTTATATNCKPGCSNDAGILKYLPGHVYEYAVDSELSVGLANNNNNNNINKNAENTDNVNLKISAKAKLYAEANCAYTLQLSEVKISSSESDVSKKQLQNIQNPLQFTLQNNGHVEPILCLQSDADNAEDNSYALNIKRAIVSLLQNQLPDGSKDFNMETDIFGECATRSSQRANDNGGGIILTKVRNLASCSHREHMQSGLMTGGNVLHGHHAYAGIANLQADYYKESKISAAGIIDHVQLTETYENAVAAQSTSGAMVKAKVYTSLKLSGPGVAGLAPKAADAHEIGIVFEVVTSDIGEVKNLAALKQTLNEVVQKLSGQVQQNAATQFVELIRLMRAANTDTLLELSQQQHKGLAHKAYLDALFRTGTSASARAILKQLPKMSKQEQFMAIAALHLVKHVDKPTLKAATALINANTANGVYLAVGHLVKKYCEHASACTADVEEIAQKFANNLKHCKATTVEEEERLITILKGIGNMGQHVGTSASIIKGLTQCSAHGNGPSHISQRLRVAALQSAANAASCNDAVQKQALDLLKDRQVDSEVRIEAYLLAIECANNEIALAINELLQDEPSYQVGGFIVSNLRVIRDSTDEARAKQRENLLPHINMDEKLMSQYPINWELYSCNHELSYKYPALGMSASADFKVLYSQQNALLPRSVRLNLTSEIYGNNFNILDVNVRQENVERILEYYFGPKGLLNKDMDDIIKTFSMNAHSPRARRSLVAETQKYAKKYKVYGQKEPASQHINFDMSLKLFGSEMGFLALGDNLPQTVDDLMQLVSTGFEQAKKNLQGYEKQFNLHTLFLDTHLIYATSIGLPLELTAQGFAASKFDIAAKLDVDTILTDNWHTTPYRVKFVPSIDATIQLRLGFKTPTMETGMRVYSKLHTATGSDINLTFGHNGKSVKANIELPQERLQLINMHIGSDFYVSEADKAVTKSMPLDKSSDGSSNVAPADSICFNQLEDYTGFDLCIVTNAMQIDINNANGEQKPWPLLHPLTFEIYIRAPKLLELSAKQSYGKDNINGVHSLSFNYATPGSSENHDTAVILAFDAVAKNARVSLNNAHLQLAAEIGVKNNDKDLIIYAQYETDSKVHSSKIGFSKLTANEYKPIIEWENLSGEIQQNLAGYEASGKLRIEPNSGRYSFDKFAITHINGEQLVQLNGWLELINNALKTDLQLTLINKETYAIVSHANMPENGNYDVGLFVNDVKQPEYVYGAAINAKLLPSDMALTLVAKARAYEVNFKSNTKYQLNDNAQEQKTDGTHSNLESLTTNNELSMQHKQVSLASAKVNVELATDKELKINVDVLRQKHHGNFDMHLQRNMPSEGHYLADIKANYNKHAINFKYQAERLSDNGRVKVHAKLDSSWGTRGSLDGQIGDSANLQLIYVDLKGDFQVSAKLPQRPWLVKIVGATDKTTADIQLKNDNNTDLLKFTSEWQHAQDKLQGANMHIMLQQLLQSNIDLKINKNGKGELTADADLLASAEPKKLDLSAKFHIIATSKYDIDATLSLNQAKLMHIKSDNLLEKTKFTTSNVLEYGQEQRVALNAHATTKGEWRHNGELQSDFDLTLPTGRRIDGEIKRKLTTNPKTGMINGMIDWQLSETKATGEKRVLQAKSKVDKFLPAQRLLINEAEWQYKDANGKEFKLNLNVKHVPKNNGHAHALDIQLTSGGNLLTNALDIKLKSDEYSWKLAKLELEAKYGQVADAKLSANYDISAYKTNTKPINYDMEMKLNLPQTQFKTYDMKSNGKWQRLALLEFNVDQNLGQSESKVNFKATGTFSKSKYDLTVKCNKMPEPLIVSGEIDIVRNYEQHGYSAHYTLNAVQGVKYLKTELDSSYDKVKGYKMLYTLVQNPDNMIMGVKQLELNIVAHALNEHAYEINLALQHNNVNKYAVETQLYGGSASPGAKQGLELHVSAPQLPAKMSVVCLSEIINSHEAKLTLELSHLMDLDLKASADAKYYKIDDFKFIINWTSEKLNLQQYVLLIETIEDGKKLHINLKNAQENILDGSATHVIKQEANKYIIEGQGELQYRAQSQRANFRLIRQNYEVGTDKEMGVSYTLNGKIGTKQGVANLKLTNREFNVKLSVCEEKKQCTNLQVQSLVNMEDEQNTSKHSLLILVDLRELGYPYEFELQSKTQRQGYKAQYSLDSNLVSHNNQRYQLIARLGTGKEGSVVIKLPQRDIVLELQQKLPANNAILGNYEQSVTLWLDHVRQPEQKTKVSLSGSLAGDVGQQATLDVQGLLKLEHTGMRTLSVEAHLQANRAKQLLSSDIKLDIFKVSEQQLSLSHKLQNILAHESLGNGFNITTHSEIKAPAFELAYTMAGHVAYHNHKYTNFMNAALNDLTAESYVAIEAEHLHFEVNALKETIMLLHAKWSRAKDSLKSHTKLQFLGQKPVDIETDLQTTQVKITVKRPEAFDAEASYKLGKELSLTINGDKGENYVNGHVALDSDKFLETTYNVQTDKLKEHLEKIELKLQHETKEAVEKLKARFEQLKDAAAKQKQNIEAALPDLAPLKTNINTNMKQIVQELEADPMIKKIAQTSRKIYETIEQCLDKAENILREIYQNLSKFFTELDNKLHDIMQKSILPIWHDIVKNATIILSKLRTEFVQFSVKLWENTMHILEKYAPILKSYGVIVQNTLKHIHEVTQELHKMLSHELEDIVKELKDILEQFKTDKLTPILERIKLQWQQWKVTEQFVEILNQLFEQLNVLPQTAESSEFLQQLHNYITAKLQKDTTVNDAKTLETLVQLAIKAIRSVIAELATHTQNPHLSHIMGWSPNSGSLTHLWSQGVKIMTKLPSLFSMRFSFINFVLNEPWNRDLIHSKALQRTWYSLWQPFELSAQLVYGGQFISFDGVYGDFKSDGNACKYILTQDSVDQNFTVVAQMTNQKLRSITLITRDGESLEMLENGILKLNGQAVEYPQHGADLHAWRFYHTIRMRSQYGVEVACPADLTLCLITVNGFYAGRLRGIMGNANTEPFDDRLLAEGTFAANNKDLVLAYSLGGKCNVIETPTPVQDELPEICAELFAWDTSFAAGFLLDDTKAYREGCQAAVQGLEADKAEEVACKWALAYVTKLRSLDLPLKMPSRCIKCQGKELGHEQQIKLPANKADIVLIVDLNTEAVVMENLIAPALLELREAYKARAFTDIQIAVVVYNESQRYPALLSSNGGKLNYEGNLAEVKLAGGPTAQSFDSCQMIQNARVVNVFETLQKLLNYASPNAETKAYLLGMKYPFRAQAVSTIVIARSTPLSKTSVLRFLDAHLSSGLINLDKSIIHLIAPVEKMSVEGIANEKLLGFNSRLIATLDGKDPKKRAKLLYGENNNHAGIELILKSGGWIFNTEHFASLKPQECKKALNQITSTIADTSFKTELVTECTCQSNISGFHGATICKVKSNNFVPNKKVKAKK